MRQYVRSSKKQKKVSLLDHCGRLIWAGRLLMRHSCDERSLRLSRQRRRRRRPPSFRCHVRLPQGLRFAAANVSISSAVVSLSLSTRIHGLTSTIRK